VNAPQPLGSLQQVDNHARITSLALARDLAGGQINFTTQCIQGWKAGIGGHQITIHHPITEEFAD
jgi:uncharacterized protein YbcV (DUF1398 family)